MSIQQHDQRHSNPWWRWHPLLTLAQLLLTLFCGVGLLWTLIDAVQILSGNVRDAYGRPLRG